MGASLKPLASSKTLALVRLQSTGGRGPQGMEDVDSKREDEIAAKRLEAHPESVSATSSMVPATDPAPSGANKEDNDEMLGGIKADLVGQIAVFGAWGSLYEYTQH